MLATSTLHAAQRRSPWSSLAISRKRVTPTQARLYAVQRVSPGKYCLIHMDVFAMKIMKLFPRVLWIWRQVATARFARLGAARRVMTP